mmetsp:Transcript_58793/g.161343  ORF Transcript_58793/g.161343 Transcript_58793/m.161343 type:complete len:232 (+) Transcript_58793:779-1474(+)
MPRERHVLVRSRLLRQRLRHGRRLRELPGQLLRPRRVLAGARVPLRHWLRGRRLRLGRGRLPQQLHGPRHLPGHRLRDRRNAHVRVPLRHRFLGQRLLSGRARLPRQLHGPRHVLQRHVRVRPGLRRARLRASQRHVLRQQLHRPRHVHAARHVPVLHRLLGHGVRPGPRVVPAELHGPRRVRRDDFLVRLRPALHGAGVQPARPSVPRRLQRPRPLRARHLPLQGGLLGP